MKNISMTLFDTNRTEKGSARLTLDSSQTAGFSQLIREMADGLYSQHETYLAIEGVGDAPVTLTVSRCDADRG